MYEYRDYFSEAHVEKPYYDAEEAYEEYCCLIEMIMENLAACRGLGKEEALFTKGLSATEDEMLTYFTDHPSLRDYDGYYYRLGQQAEFAFSHIEGRENHTPAKVLLPIKKLKEGYGLSRGETIILLLSYMCHKHRSYERVCGFLQDDMQSTEPSLGLALTMCNRVIEDNSPKAEVLLSKDRGLIGSIFRKEGIDEVFPLRSNMVLTDAALRFLNGEEEKTEGLLTLEKEDGKLPALEAPVEALTAVAKQDGEKILYLAAEDTGAAAFAAKKVCASKKEKLYSLSFPMFVATDEDAQQDICDTLCFSAGFAPTRLLLTGVTAAVLKEENTHAPLRKLLSSERLASVWMTGDAATPELLKTGALTGTPVLNFKVKKPNATERAELWNYAIKSCGLSVEKGFDVDALADCYEVGTNEILTAVKQAGINILANGEKKLNKDQMSEALKGIGTVNFRGLAKEVKTVYTWDDLKLNNEQRNILQTACDRYKMKNRIGEGWGITKKNAYGNGVSVLLYGPPGTGKTMSAQVMAREIGLPLYRVDTSQLFSKYIGETQKNLNSVFDEAERSNVILFFDEADALFSKRTDVESSNDRHANQEIAFLLQRIEEYKGMSLLATNYYSGFDAAFVRRITYAARLEQPDEAARLLLWQSVLPDAVPKEKDIDFKFLAKNFELTGSNIKAIMLSAVYMAGAAGAKLSMQYIVRAMKYEFDKLGMMPDSAKFGPYAAFLYG